MRSSSALIRGGSTRQTGIVVSELKPFKMPRGSISMCHGERDNPRTCEGLCRRVAVFEATAFFCCSASFLLEKLFDESAVLLTDDSS